jgi:hypothetical protein
MSIGISFPAANQTADFTFRIGLPQLEQGTFATSALKTANAGVAPRAAEFGPVSGAAFAAFWNQPQGTLQAVFASMPPFGALTRSVVASNADGTSYISLSRRPTTNMSRYSIADAGVDQTQVDIAQMPLSVFSNVVGAYALNNCAGAADGVLGADPDGLATIPVVDRLHIGSNGSADFLNGWIKSIRYWNTRLTDTQLQALSAGGGVRNGGLLYNSDGALVVANGGAIFGYAQGGLPVNSDGALCVAYGGTPARFLAGIPFDAAGRVCMVAPVPPVELEAFDISFDDPAFG